MKKKIISSLTSIILISLLLCGCGAKNESADVTSDRNALTQAQWIGMLGDCFGYTETFEKSDYVSNISSDDSYFNQIQACAEWGVLGDNIVFEPNLPVTWAYAMETAVRAIGIDNINTSTVGQTVDESDLIGFYSNNIAKIDVSDMTLSPTEEEAKTIMQYAYDYYMELKPSNLYQVSYNNEVCEVDAKAISLKGDGMTALINDGASYEVGEIIYVEPSSENTAYAIRVISCQDNQITYETAGMEDVFEEMVVRGSYDANIVDVETAEYVSALPIEMNDLAVYAVRNTTGICSFDKEVAMQAMKTGFDVKFSNNSVLFKGEKNNLDLEVSITNIKVNPDIEYGVFKGLRKANATVTFDDKIKVNYKKSLDQFARPIPLGAAIVEIPSTPVFIKISLVANIGIDGEVSITYSSNVVGKVQYSKGKNVVASVNNNNAQLDFHAQVTITAEPTFKVELMCLNMSIVNFKVTTGVVAIATIDTDLLGNQPTCIDLYLYVPLRWAVNEDGCLMTAISKKLKKSETVWDSTNSPISQRYHWENLVLVDACTRGENQAVETPTLDETGKAYDEYKLFEFEEIEFGTIEVASQTIILDPGETMTIGIVKVPDGYSVENLVYTSENEEICTVNGSRVTANSSGSTMLKIATADGKYSVYVAVVVTGGYNDTTTFESL